MRNWPRHEAALLRQFDGRTYVATSLWNAWPRHAHRACELGYELGYRLTDALVTRFSIHLEFRRDDRPPARARARGGW
ncbi:hypothetical protein, partial [Yinghuangia sp. YIM S09857]|uniref:hypothetical protein n=1 Tax=Yinghuangia sp. YIM S09857 TaxID=3436929 RepID=UPI003F531BED